jgi:hypothetical protein
MKKQMAFLNSVQTTSLLGNSSISGYVSLMSPDTESGPAPILAAYQKWLVKESAVSDLPVATPAQTSVSTAIHHTFASFEQAAISAATLLHPSNQQPVLLPHHFNKEPILLPHFCIPRTSSYFCYQPLQTSSQFGCPHLFQQAAKFAIIPLHLRSRSHACHCC